MPYKEAEYDRFIESEWGGAEEIGAKAAHFSEGKSGVDQIPPEVLVELGNIYTFGMSKYGRDNWLKGTQWSEFYGSLLRHLLAWRRRQDTDPESALPHLSHALWNCVALLHYQRYGLGEDDRPSQSMLSDAYIAGLLDGEGSIHISRSVRKPSNRLQFALRLTITNTDSIIIQQLQEMFGGNILTPPMEGKLGTKKVYVWNVNGPVAAEVLERLYPHLRIKKMEALEAITFQHRQRTDPRENAPLTEEEIQEREDAYWTLRELKHLPSELGKDTR